MDMNPDMNTPDSKVRTGIRCLIYGFDSNDPVLSKFNGKKAFVLKRAFIGQEGYYPQNEVWYSCQVEGDIWSKDIRSEHLMHLDDSDDLVIELLERSNDL